MASERAQWIKDNPPNHAGYYLCHICGGWVHVDQAELDHVTPKSLWNTGIGSEKKILRMSHAWPQTRPDGSVYCIGNRGKGSKQIESVTLEIAPGDEEW